MDNFPEFPERTDYERGVHRMIRTAMETGNYSLDSGSVYIVEFAGYFKIGVTTNFTKRLKGFASVVLPFKFNGIFIWPCADPYRTEKYLHFGLQHYRVRGEWFDLDPKMLACAKWMILRYANECPDVPIKRAAFRPSS
jgi:hypothetical protein